MSRHTATIIAEPSRAAGPAAAAAERRFASGLAILTMLWGTAAAIVYHLQGLTLSHYDARAHLVVARRIIDSLTPGWEQIGAVWLPLPHLLNMLPVQIDWLYTTGASGVAISVASLGLAVYAVASLILHATASRPGAAVAAALIALNPNLLYLQSTPMTEPLLFGSTAYAAWALYRWSGDPIGWGRTAGWALVAASMTRYEAWPFMGAAVALAAAARWHASAFRPAAGETLRLVLYPAAAIVIFLFHSRATVGQWFVTGGFYIPDPALQGHAAAVARTIWTSACDLGSTTLMLSAAAAAVLVVAEAVRQRRPAPLVLLALLAVAALPFYAFYAGHPLRIRYMVPLVFGAAACVGLGLGCLPVRRRAPAAALVLLGVLAGVRPFAGDAPMVQEAQWDIERTRARRALTACLAARREPHDSVLASMSALAHYMQDMAADGFHIRDFIHEGNGLIWHRALARPAAHVNWMLIDVRSKHRDQLKARAESDPSFLQGFSPVCEAAGVAAYRRDAYRPPGRPAAGPP